MNRQRIFSFLGFVAIIALAFFIFKAMTSKKPKPPDVKAFSALKYANSGIAEYQEHEPEIEAFGRLHALNSIEVFSEVGGKMTLSSGRFKVGNLFSRGDIMIQIDPEEAEINLLSLKSEFLNLLTSIMPDIKADFPSEYNKWSSYLEKYDIKKTLAELPEYSSAKEKYFLASRKIFQNYYNVKNAELRMDKHIIRAPFDGIVTESMIEPGTIVRIGQKLGKFSGTGQFELELTYSADDIKLLREGMTVIIEHNDSGAEFEGRIARIARSIDPATQTVKAYVYLSGQGLKEGMYLRAVTRGSKLPASIALPRAALVNNSHVYLIKNGTLVSSDIEIIKIGNDLVYLTGIAPGDTIVSEPLVNPEIGMKIEPVFNNSGTGAK